jgi:hypothetical protein
MKNKIFSIFKNNNVKKTYNQPKIEYFNVNLFNANQFKLTSCFFFNSNFNYKKAEVIENLKQKKIIDINNKIKNIIGKKSFIIYSKNQFCYKEKNEEKIEKKENFLKRTMRELKQYGFKGLRIYYILYLSGIAFLYFLIEKGFINSKIFKYK